MYKFGVFFTGSKANLAINFITFVSFISNYTIFSNLSKYGNLLIYKSTTRVDNIGPRPHCLLEDMYDSQTNNIYAEETIYKLYNQDVFLKDDKFYKRPIKVGRKFNNSRIAKYFDTEDPIELNKDEIRKLKTSNDLVHKKPSFPKALHSAVKESYEYVTLPNYQNRKFRFKEENGQIYYWSTKTHEGSFFKGKNGSILTGASLLFALISIGNVVYGFVPERNRYINLSLTSINIGMLIFMSCIKSLSFRTKFVKPIEIDQNPGGYRVGNDESLFEESHVVDRQEASGISEQKPSAKEKEKLSDSERKLMKENLSSAAPLTKSFLKSLHNEREERKAKLVEEANHSV